MRKRGARQRKWGVKRHPDGSQVRTVWARGASVTMSAQGLSDEALAALVDPRYNSEAGKLELLHERDLAAGLKPSEAGGITRFERQAGERWAMVKEAYRKLKDDGPNPNPPAADPLKSTGKTHEADPFNMTDEEKRTLREVVANFAKGLKAFEGIENGIIARFRIRDLFVLDRPIGADVIPVVRVALQNLQVHLGLTTERRGDAQQARARSRSVSTERLARGQISVRGLTAK